MEAEKVIAMTRRLLAISTVGLMIAVAACDGGDPDVASTEAAATTTAPSAPEEAWFSFADNDLCEWVSEAEVAQFVSEAYSRSGIDWDGIVAAVEPVGSAWDLPGSDYCRWEPTGGGYVIARGLVPSQFPPVIDYSEWDQDEQRVLPTVSGHPGVSDGTIAASAAFGRYGFWMEGSDEVLGIEVALEGGDTTSWAQQEEMLFVIADSFLTQMGWTM